MIYLKSFFVGIVAAIVTSALWIVVTLVIPLFGPFLLARWSDYSGGSVAVINSGSILVAALVGFAAGFAWTLRRGRQALTPQ